MTARSTAALLTALSSALLSALLLLGTFTSAYAATPLPALAPPGSAIAFLASALESSGSVLESSGSALESSGSALESSGSALESSGSAVAFRSLALEFSGSRTQLPGLAPQFSGLALESSGSLVAFRSSALASPGEWSGAAGLAFTQKRPSKAELDQHIATASRRLEVVVEKFNTSREDLRDTRQRTAQLGAQLGPLTRELAQRQALVDGLLSNTYQRTRTGPTMALFASDQPHEFVDKLLVLHQLAAEERRAADDLREARAKVDGTRAMLDALSAQQRRQQIQLNTRKATVEGEIVALKQMRAIAYGGGSRYTDSGDIPAPEYVPGPAGRVVDFAFNQLGKPYRWGADGPGSYDCSGLTLAAWRTVGVHLPHNAARQYASEGHVGRSDLRPGDLVFFYGPISHVGIYIGSGRMIHAPEYGENVRVASIDSQPIAGFARPG
ncbi:NlpC/P60 family protein [Actinoplanes sp. NPDC051859]|uniref:C40 family peptidase n=1 Tax=Actinoplanes sp. NPDC051859 TaxID=3363909 RepID=UPI00378F819F